MAAVPDIEARAPEEEGGDSQADERVPAGPERGGPGPEGGASP